MEPLWMLTNDFKAYTKNRIKEKTIENLTPSHWWYPNETHPDLGAAT